MVGLGAEVGGHPTQDHGVDAALAQLQYQVVGFRSVHLMGICHDRLTVLDVLLVEFQPIRAGAFETVTRCQQVDSK